MVLVSPVGTTVDNVSLTLPISFLNFLVFVFFFTPLAGNVTHSSQRFTYFSILLYSSQQIQPLQILLKHQQRLVSLCFYDQLIQFCKQHFFVQWFKLL